MSVQPRQEQLSRDLRFPELPVESDELLAYRTDETYWGYILRERSGSKEPMVVAQAVAGLMGLVSVAVSVGFWVLPGAFFSADVAMFKWVASVMACVFGIFLLWYASAGTTYELQVDLTKSELREVMRNAKGQPRVHSRYAFQDIGKVFIQSGDDGEIESSLMLRCGLQGDVIEVLRAPEHQLFALRNRLAKDLSKAAPATRRNARGQDDRQADTPPASGSSVCGV